MLELIKNALEHFVGIDNGETVQYTIEQDDAGIWYIDIKCDWRKRNNDWDMKDWRDWEKFDNWLYKNGRQPIWWETGSYIFDKDHIEIDIYEY